MTKPGIIWDKENNCRLKFEYPDLSQTVRQGIEETIANNTSRCLDPIKSRGHCLRISDELMLNLADLGKRPFIDCKILHSKDPKPHFWIYVDGWHIDLTARQFDPKEPCPKIWRQEINSRKIYEVEKGKGKVLFQLVPFNSTAKAVQKHRTVFEKFKSLIQPLAKTVNDSYLNWLETANSFK